MVDEEDKRHPKKISSLEEYFTYIYNLVNLKKGGDETYGRKYTILPVQEEYFEIDANARTITIPEIFRKNGIGVAGDQAAETIYFKINRYFDAMDLNNTDIYIQWKNTSSNIAGISKEWVRDIETFDDYLIFGWVLGEDILQQSGTLQFSIRFINPVLNNDGYATSYNYSLNTLRAQVLVNPGLDVSLTENKQDDSLNTVLLKNIRNTTSKTDSELKLFGWSYLFDDLIDSEKSNIKDNIIYADLINNQLEFWLSAYSDKGEINYQLYKESGNNTIKDYTISSNMEFDYKNVQDDLFNENIDYYHFNDGTKEYDLDVNYKGEKDPVTGEIKVGANCYIKCGKHILTESAKASTDGTLTGNYYGTATVKMADDSTTSPITTSVKVQLQPPTAVTLLKIEEEFGHAVNQSIKLEYINKNEKDKISYIWEKKNNDKFEAINLSLNDDGSITPTEQGLYKGYIKSERNGDIVNSVNEHLFYVTVLPVLTDDNLVNFSKANSEEAVEVNGSAYITPRVKYTPENQLEGTDYHIYVQWYIKDVGETDYNPLGDKIELLFDETKGEFKGAPITIKNEPGTLYYYTVIAEYNQLTTTRESIELLVV